MSKVRTNDLSCLFDKRNLSVGQNWGYQSNKNKHIVVFFKSSKKVKTH